MAEDTKATDPAVADIVQPEAVPAEPAVDAEVAEAPQDIAYFVAIAGIDLHGGARIEADDHVKPGRDDVPDWLIEQGILQPVYASQLVPVEVSP